VFESPETMEPPRHNPTPRTADDYPAHGESADATAPPTLGSEAHRIERRVLFELLVEGRTGGCNISDLAARLDEPLEAVLAAATALAAVGLAEISREAVFAAPAARYFDALWPIAI
jgi:hypothetical protein